MRRRDFITLVGGAAATWPLAVRGQQPERMRRIGVLIDFAADDPEGQALLRAFLQGLQQFGWTDGRNMRIDRRWGASDVDLVRRFAMELATLAPDVVLAGGATAVRLLQQASDTVPIVFAAVTDPVGAGLVASLPQPGGNITGFLAFEYHLSGKWLELLKQIAPGMTRAAVIRDAATTAGIAQFGAIQTAAPTFGVEVTPVDARDADEIERAVTAFARSSNGGLIVTSSRFAFVHRDLIMTLAAQHRLPAAYPYRHYLIRGGLISYGPDQIYQYQRAASYVDRILRGEMPGHLPVQAPTKYELGINLKVAKALGLTVPNALLVAADEVIE
jgi:putative ABC transport system substrate-binding protein